MTYKTLVNEVNKLNIEAPDTEALLIIEYLFGASRSDTLIYPERDYDDTLISPILRRRTSGEPLYYIIGRVFFFGCEIKVNNSCLIPRSDTEVLCEYLIDHLPTGGHFLELCTGSGCIPIAILSNRADLTCNAIELIPATARLAEENRNYNKIEQARLSITTGDALNLDADKHPASYDAIVSNPPYIRTDVIPSLSKEVQHEPIVALDGGNDGLIFYKKFISTYAKMLKPEGFFAFEIGYDQAEDITKLCSPLNYSVQIIKDYSGNDRVAIIKPE